MAYGLFSDDWDAGVAFLPDVAAHNGQYYLFYTGSPDVMTTPLSIGFASSADGYHWTKHISNPVFSADGTGFDAFAVDEGKLLLQDNVWIMYYNARAVPGPGPGPAIGRASAPDPAGPWTRLDDPVLLAGSAGEWDAGFVSPDAILTTDSGYVMYYSGGTNYPLPPSDHAMVGMATSADGITWQKYDDPATTAPPFSESDPVLLLGAAGAYDSGLAWETDVLITADGFEMFYTGDPDSWSGERLCYATSRDGIHWTKSAANPILAPDGQWASLDLVAPTVMMVDGTYFVYFTGNTTLINGQIGLATSTATNVRTESVEKISWDFHLKQNYPNPFNAETRIEVASDRPGTVELSVYDVLGRRVHTLLAQRVSAGTFDALWDGTDRRGRRVADGVYLFELVVDGQPIQAREMVFIRDH